MKTNSQNKSKKSISKPTPRSKDKKSAKEIVDRYSRDSMHYADVSHKKRKKKKGVALVAVLVSAVLVAVVAALVFMYVQNLNYTLTGGKSQQQLDTINEELTTVTSYSDPFNVLLIGSDSRQDTLDGSLSDTNILVRIDPGAGKISMISIPRDMKVTTTSGGTLKFNSIYALEGVAGVIRTVKDLYDVEIAHYVEVGFYDLIALVDVIGGVTVDVPELIDDPNAGDYVIQEGEQTLNGDQALVFARSRAYADGDFTRTSNQRLLIEAMLTKVLQLPVNEIPGAITEMSKSVITDMEVSNIISIANEFKDFGSLVIYSAMVPCASDMINGVSYVVPIEYQVDEMMQLFSAGDDPSSIFDENGLYIGLDPVLTVEDSEESINQPGPR